MRAGKLKEKITLYNVAEVRNPLDGGFEESVTMFCETRAEVKRTGGTERIVADQIFPSEDITVTIRYRDGIDESMQLLWRDTMYQIDNVNEIPYKKDLILRCNKQLA